MHGRLGVPLSTRPRLAEDDWARFGEALTEVADTSPSAGCGSRTTTTWGPWWRPRHEIDRLMTRHGPAVGLLLDTGHLTYRRRRRAARGAAPRAAGSSTSTARTSGRTCWRRRKRRDQSFLDAVVEGVFTVPGDGCVDYKALLAVLRDAGYAGWLVVEAEQDPKKAHPLTYARMGFAHLSRLLADLRM